MIAGTRQRLLQGVAASMSWQPLGTDGDPATVDPGVVTVGVVTAHGDEVISAGTATIGEDVSPRTVPLTVAQMANLDTLHAAWAVDDVTVATTSIDIVGGVYFTTTDLKAAEKTLTDVAPSVLATVRCEVETSFESWTQLAMVPRFDVHRCYTSNGVVVLPFPYLRRVRWVRIWNPTFDTPTFTELDVTGDTANPEGIIVLPYYDCTVDIGYEHGLDAPPADGRRMALLYARICALRSVKGISAAAVSFTTPEGQTISYEPDVEPTNYKVINEFLRRRGIDHRTPSTG